MSIQFGKRVLAVLHSAIISILLNRPQVVQWGHHHLGQQVVTEVRQRSPWDLGEETQRETHPRGFIYNTGPVKSC